MESLKRLGTSRTALLAMLLIALVPSIVLLLPAQAEAVCCGFRFITNYYSDESKTVWVGRCVDNDCTGEYYCTGEQTPYESFSMSCCFTCSG
jgi:hypothetical protein